MGLMTNILMLVAFMAFALSILGAGTGFTNFSSGVTNMTSTITDFVGALDLGTATAVGAAVITVSAVFVPSALQYVLFAGVAFAFISFLTLIDDVFQGIGFPAELEPLKLGFIVILSFFLLIGIVSWFKHFDQ